MPMTPLPPAPSRSDAPATFIAKADAFVASLALLVTEINATSAGFDVSEWDAATDYDVGNMVWSPISFRTYRRRVAGISATDPSQDATNWADVLEPQRAVSDLYNHANLGGL